MHRIDAMKNEGVLVDFCHTNLGSWGTKLFWALPCKNLRPLMWLKHPILRCRIARTTLIPLYLLLKSPSFTRQKLEETKIICGFGDTKDKISIPEKMRRSLLFRNITGKS